MDGINYFYILKHVERASGDEGGAALGSAVRRIRKGGKNANERKFPFTFHNSWGSLVSFFLHNLQRRTLVGGCYKIAQKISQGWGWVGGGRDLEAKEKWLINLFHEILTNVKREHNQRLDLCEMLCEFFHGEQQQRRLN